MEESQVAMLLVEDNKDFREHISLKLRERFSSMKISEAGSCFEALSVMKSDAHNLVIMDISLPDGMGLELTKIITESFSEVVVVIMSVNDMPEYREASFKSGASHFLSKCNFSSLDIVSFVEKFLSGKVYSSHLN